MNDDNDNDMCFEDHVLRDGNENLAFHWVEWTPGQRPHVAIDGRHDDNPVTILCIHGSYQTCHTWDEFASCVLQGGSDHHQTIRVIGVDLRGHGDSQHSASGYSLEQMTKDIVVFMEKVGLRPESTVLVGMSLGGLIAMGVAVAVPQLLGMVVVDITPSVTPEGSQQIQQNMQQSQELESFEGFVQWAHRVNPSRSLDNLRSRLQYSLKKTDRGTWTWKYDPQFAASLVAGQSHSLWGKLPLIRCMTLVIRGGKSNVTTIDDCQRLVSLISRGKLIQIDDAGHSVQGDQPQRFTSAVLDMVREALKPSSAKL